MVVLIYQSALTEADFFFSITPFIQSQKSGKSDFRYAVSKQPSETTRIT